MVGDTNQLPSVGPGAVLKDVISSGCFTVVSLKKIFRQAELSDIVVNAHKINEGKHPVLDNKSRDFFFLERDNVDLILNNIIHLIREKLPRYVNAKPGDIQVLTPMRKGELGVERLNMVLQRYLNPADPEKKEHAFHGGVLRTGDKVMQIRNDYQLEWEVVGKYNIVQERGTGVFNGDMGIVLEINDFAEEVTVEYDECRQVHYSFQQLDELELAYAVTVHKAQGSEYPAVVIPLLTGPAPLMNRNILYTAVTRARSCVAIVGSDETVRNMIDNERQQHRYTTLQVRIREQEEADRLVE
jgi:exodeoxyribonuclease V alpha subunit